jgi:hypothetical protein
MLALTSRWCSWLLYDIRAMGRYMPLIFHCCTAVRLAALQQCALIEIVPMHVTVSLP